MFKIIFTSLLISLSFFSQAQTAVAIAEMQMDKLIAYEKNSRLFIEWVSETADPAATWEVQRSIDGKQFKTIGLVMGADPSKSVSAYGYKGNAEAQFSKAYYRVVQVDRNAGKQYSRTIQTIKMESVSFVNETINNTNPAKY